MLAELVVLKNVGIKIRISADIPIPVMNTITGIIFCISV